MSGGFSEDKENCVARLVWVAMDTVPHCIRIELPMT